MLRHSILERERFDGRVTIISKRQVDADRGTHTPLQSLALLITAVEGCVGRSTRWIVRFSPAELDCACSTSDMRR
jgi:hypothetical protein